MLSKGRMLSVAAGAAKRRTAASAGQRGALFRAVRPDAAATSARFEHDVDPEDLIPAEDVDAAFRDLEQHDKVKVPTLAVVSIDAVSDRSREASRLQRLAVPKSPLQLENTTFSDLDEMVREWRALLGLEREDGLGAGKYMVATPLGSVTFKIMSNSPAIERAAKSQLVQPQDVTRGTDVATCHLCCADVTLVAGDVKERPSPHSLRALDQVTPLQAGTASDDIELLSALPVTASADVSVSEQTLAKGSGTAYQTTHQIHASLRFKGQDICNQGTARSRHQAASDRLGGPQRVLDYTAEGTQSRADLDEARGKYVHHASHSFAKTPVTAFDRNLRRSAVVAPTSEWIARRDTLRNAMHTTFFGATVPLVNATLIPGAAVSDPTTGDSVLVLGAHGSGRRSVAFHSVVQSGGRLGLVSDGLMGLTSTRMVRAAGAIGREAEGSVVNAILGRVDTTSTHEKVVWPQSLCDEDLLLFGPPLHPLVGVGALLGVPHPRDTGNTRCHPITQQLEAAQPPSWDAADVDWFQGHDSDFAATCEPNELWSVRRRVRVDIQRCVGDTTAFRRRNLQPCAGRLRHIVVLDWNHPASSAATPLRAISVPVVPPRVDSRHGKLRLQSRHTPFWGGAIDGTTVERVTNPAAVEAVFRATTAFAAHPCVEAIRTAARGSAVVTGSVAAEGNSQRPPRTQMEAAIRRATDAVLTPADRAAEYAHSAWQMIAPVLASQADGGITVIRGDVNFAVATEAVIQLLKTSTGNGSYPATK